MHMHTSEVVHLVQLQLTLLLLLLLLLSVW